MPLAVAWFQIVLILLGFFFCDNYAFLRKASRLCFRTGLLDRSLLDAYDIDIVYKLCRVLDTEIATIASVAAVKTVSTYMLEFRDDASQKWMVGYLGGVGATGWKTYIENMIELDKFETMVQYKPPKQLRTRNSQPDAKNVVLQYSLEIQPRKIAHQIVTVRENVAEELIQDISSIQLEHTAAINFATEVVSSGREEAEKHRPATREAALGESTPHRNSNFNTCSVLITNLALDLVRSNLKKNGENEELVCLDELLNKIEGDNSRLSPTDKHIRERLYGTGPRALMEELYYTGLVKGVDKETGANYMKVAESVMSTRLGIALEAQKSLKSQNAQYRTYFQMIKDCGGFTRFNMRQKTVIEVVDLDIQAQSYAAAAASSAVYIDVKKVAVDIAAATITNDNSDDDDDLSRRASIGDKADDSDDLPEPRFGPVSF